MDGTSGCGVQHKVLTVFFSLPFSLFFFKKKGKMEVVDEGIMVLFSLKCKEKKSFLIKVNW